jgi:hypothetical protein
MNGIYSERNLQRQTLMENATMALVAHFMGLGDDKTTADDKVTQLSTEVAVWIYPYVLGNMKLIEEVNASQLSFMDAAAKAVIVDILDYQNG